MKSLLVLLIIPFLLVIPSFVYATEFFVVTDKAEYFIGETIIVSGEVTELAEHSQSITIVVVNSNDSIVTIAQITSNEDKTFNFEFYVREGSESGTYEIRLQYGADKIETTFEIIPNPLNIQTDKHTYYINDNIFVNGTINEIDESRATTISYEVTYNGIIDSGGAIQLHDDNTFDFTIDDIDWSHTGDTTLIVNIQDYTSIFSFTYSSEPDKTNEANYERIVNNENVINTYNTRMNNQDIMLDSHDVMVNEHSNNFISHNDRFDAMQAALSALQTQVDGLKEQLDGEAPDDNIVIPIISNFIATPTGSGTVTLSWDIQNDPITLYNLIYRAQIGVWTTEDVNVNATSYIISDLQSIEYDFKFSAENEFGESKIEKFTLTP